MLSAFGIFAIYLDSLENECFSVKNEYVRFLNVVLYYMEIELMCDSHTLFTYFKSSI